MFTGIIERTGTVEEVRRGAASAVLTVEAGELLNHTREGDSISVNGVCLTVNAKKGGAFCADVMHETMKRTSLSILRAGSRVNLERAMAADGRFGGHLVTGHVDGTGNISAVRKDDNAIWFTIRASPSILKYLVEKGSIAIDGISLTVVSVREAEFLVSVIPHTLKKTTLADKKAGAVVNLENDCIAKYVEKFLGQGTGESGMSREFLKKYGY
ncbi:riboflavin synthase [Lachnospiraceae bacterium 54-53]